MSVLESAIGWLAPPQCISCGTEGLAFCDACSTSYIVPFGERCAYCGRLSLRAKTCLSCRPQGAPRFVWITSNYEAVAQQLVQAYKFGHLRVANQPLSNMMVRTLRDFANPAVLRAMNYLVIPLPTATSRVRQRGFDHSAMLAKAVAAKLDLEYCPGLGRLGQSRQVGASRQARLSQNIGNFFIRQPHRLPGRNILLVDDVITTGGSLIAATKSLRSAGAAHVDALVFAKRL